MRLGNDYDWTSAAVAMLRQLWLAGISSQEIARRLRTTKNAVVNKRRRLELPGRPSPIANRAPALVKVPDPPADTYDTPLDRMRRRDEAVRPLLTRMWADGEGQGAIGQACGIGRDAVIRLAKAWELPKRGAKPDRVPGGPRCGHIGRRATERDADDEPADRRRVVPTLNEVLASSATLAGLGRQA